MKRKLGQWGQGVSKGSPKQLCLRLSLSKTTGDGTSNLTELLLVEDEVKERSFQKGVDLLWKASVPQTPGPSPSESRQQLLDPGDR